MLRENQVAGSSKRRAARMTKLRPSASRALDVADETPLRRELVFVVPGRLDQIVTGDGGLSPARAELLQPRGQLVGPSLKRSVDGTFDG